jgi:hypothetical protein
MHAPFTDSRAKKSGSFFSGVATKRDLVFIAIGELHVGVD